MRLAGAVTGPLVQRLTTAAAALRNAGPIAVSARIPPEEALDVE